MSEIKGKNSENSKKTEPRSVSEMLGMLLGTVALLGGLGGATLYAGGSTYDTTRSTYPTAEQLGQKTGKRVVVMVEQGDKRFARDFCWALDRPVNLDEDSFQGIGCEGVKVASDQKGDILSGSEQIDTCKSKLVGGKISLIVDDNTPNIVNPPDSDIKFVCLIDPKTN